MSGLDLQVLRTAKAALDEGLLEPADYHAVKASFIKAQSIRAGVDAGFIGDADYAEARREFFSALGGSMPCGVGSAPSGHAPRPPHVAVHAPAPAAKAVTAVRPPPAPASLARSVPSKAPEPASPVRGSQSVGDKATGAIPHLTIPEPLHAMTPVAAGAETPNSLISTPTGLSDRGGRALVADKRSVAGIGVHPDAVNIVCEMRVKKAYRWVTFKIGAEGKEVVIDQAAQPASSWDDFVAALPPAACRYGVFDYEYYASDGTKFDKMCFVSWAPDEANVKQKMQHAPTKDLFRGVLEGVAVELIATEPEELDEITIREKVSNTVARK